MTVKSKLLANTTLTIVGIAVIAGLGLYSIKKIKSSIEILTGKSTPLHLKMLELQQTVEKVSADFLRLGMTTDQADVGKLSESINSRIKRMESLNGEIRQEGNGSDTSGIDTAVLRDIEKTVGEVVVKRLKDMELFSKESSVVNSELKKAEDGIAAMNKSVMQLGGSALGAINKSQMDNQQLNSNVKKLLTLQSRLKDIGILMGDLELIKNRFKLTPIKENIKNVMSLTRSVEYETDDHLVVKEVRGAVLDLLNKMVRDDGGLVAMKQEILASADKKDTEQYSSLKQEFNRQFEENTRKIADAIDSLEILIAKDRKNVSTSINFQGAASGVIESASSVGVDVKELNSVARLIILSSSVEELDKIAINVRQLNDRINTNMERMRKILTQSGQTNLAKSITGVSGIVRKANASIETIRNAKRDVIKSDVAMQKALNSARTISKDQAIKSEEQVKTIGESQQQILSGVRKASTQSTYMSWLMLVVSVAIAAVSVLTSWRIIVSITRPIGNAKTIAAEIARGDLTNRIDIHSSDEIGEICTSINNITSSLHEVISQVKLNAEHVSASAKELFITSEHMAEGAETVAGQAGTVATASEEMSATSMEIAKNCIAAAEGSKQANDSALIGAKVIQDTIMGMNRIADNVNRSARTIESLGVRSEQIGVIVGTINDIADQTNLLALNAAIEAARAGDEGRGFAVVADEVRALAVRTSSATQEISSMIKTIQQETKLAVSTMEEGVREVKKGTLEAAKSGEALQDILNRISSVTIQVSQIATASEEQTATTNDISNNIQQMSSVVNDTAKGAQESSIAAGQLTTLADSLQHLIGKFRLV